MGIQDRDYYRDDEPTWWATAARARVTYGLMLLLAAVFVAQVLGSNPRRGGQDDVLLNGGLYDLAATLRGQVWRPVTSFFVHRREALLVVGLALWGFYYFGSRVEGKYGSLEYAAYLAATVAAIAAAKLAAGLGGFEAELKTFGSLPLLWSVLTLYVCVAPRSQLFLGLNVPTLVLVLVPFGLTLGLELEGGPVASGLVALPVGVAWTLAYFKLDPRLASRLGLDRLLGIARPRGSRLKIARTPAETPREREAATDQTAREILGAYSRPTPPTPAAPVALDEQLEAKLDQVLEKVSRSGKDSLTGDEQNILRRASEIYKQRRGT